jgi:Carboxypeptidase regulatory-like domain
MTPISKRIAFALLALARIATAQIPDPAGQVFGIVTNSDGKPVPYAIVTVHALGDAKSAPFQRSAPAAANGRFAIAGIPAGTYQLCAQLSGTEWLNPCEWSGKPVTVTLRDRGVASDLNLVMTKGYILPIRVNDGIQILSQLDAKVPGAHLLIGVGGPGTPFKPAALQSRDATGRVYAVAVPFGQPLRVSVFSTYFQLADDMGAPVLANALTRAIQVAATETKSVTVQVTGLKVK